jgi:uncharacterized protein (DUF2249 family)
MITGDTTIGRLLDEHPELVEVLARYHPHFEKLRFGLLRKVMAPRVTVEQAARIAGIVPGDLLGAIRRAVGDLEPPAPPAATPSSSWVPAPRPAVLTARRPVHVDVRDDIQSGVEPFARIIAASKALSDEETLVLRTPFEPIPLYDVLGRRGLAHWTERRAADDWWVWFYGEPRDAAEGVVAPPSVGGAEPLSGALMLDVRGLEPPLPMMRVLERLDGLAEGAQLEVIHDRRPLFLYPQLDERGFVHETDEPETGVVRIRIRKRPRPGP